MQRLTLTILFDETKYLHPTALLDNLSKGDIRTIILLLVEEQESLNLNTLLEPY